MGGWGKTNGTDSRGGRLQFRLANFEHAGQPRSVPPHCSSRCGANGIIHASHSSRCSATRISSSATACNHWAQSARRVTCALCISRRAQRKCLRAPIYSALAYPKLPKGRAPAEEPILPTSAITQRCARRVRVRSWGVIYATALRPARAQRASDGRTIGSVQRPARIQQLTKNYSALCASQML